MHDNAPENHPRHHRQDIARMLSEGGKAHNGENAACCWAIEITPAQKDQHNADQPVDTHVDQHWCSAEHTQIVTRRTTTGFQQTPVAGPDTPDWLSTEEQPHQNQCQAQAPSRIQRPDLRLSPTGTAWLALPPKN